mmetsp:Transcript_22532/g.72494  ORF Transcript_22532/g.72494 Transcript_22532/m.72494 type:complete len:206 (-) Transcript_22532:600-1217(-)
MRIAVEKARLDDLVQKALRRPLCELFAVQADLVDLGEVRQFKGLDVLHRQDARRRIFPIDLGDPDAVLRPSEVPPEAVRIVGLVHVVDFLIQQLLRLVEDVDVGPVGAVRLRVELIQKFAQLSQVLQVHIEKFLQARALHLDGHLLRRIADLQRGYVDLSQGRGRDGLFVEVREDFRHVLHFQFLRDDLLRARPRERRDVVLQRL